MSTVGERMAGWPKVSEEMRQRAKWRRRLSLLRDGGCVILAIAIVLASLFAVVYLVTLAVRLGWGT
jgi:hypothetical protein